jgi:hypothetical protein
MMHREDQSFALALVATCFDFFHARLQPIQLRVPDVGNFLRRVVAKNPEVFGGVRVEPDELKQLRLQHPVNAGLIDHLTIESGGQWRLFARRRAKIFAKRFERDLIHRHAFFAIVVSRDSDDLVVIIGVRPVKFVIVKIALAVSVNDIAKMKEKRRTLRVIAWINIARHRFGDRLLRGLRAAAGIA